MEMTITLTQEEIIAIVQVLGQLPTSSNAYPLMVKINQQSQEQSSKTEQDVL
jgi:hypothetical protein